MKLLRILGLIRGRQKEQDQPSASNEEPAKVKLAKKELAKSGTAKKEQANIVSPLRNRPEPRAPGKLGPYDNDLTILSQFKHCVRIEKVAPLPTKETVSGWYGGKPRVPEDFVWPEDDQVPMTFFAQLNCSQFPKELWGGVGPRSGWLLFFIRSTYPSRTQEQIACKVVHIDDTGPERTNPVEDSVFQEFCWFGTYGQKNWEHTVTPFPKWPIRFLPIVENGSFKPHGEGRNPAPPDADDFDQYDELYPPTSEFFEETVEELLKKMESISDLASTKDKLSQFKKKIDVSASADLIDSVIWIEFLEVLKSKELDAKKLLGYRWKLRRKRMMIARYLENAGTMPLRPRLALEKDILQDCGTIHDAVGGLPRWDHVYTEYFTPDLYRSPEDREYRKEKNGYDFIGDPPFDKDNAVVLQLFSSQTMGWIFGDLSHVVFIAPRSSIARNDFSETVLVMAG